MRTDQEGRDSKGDLDRAPEESSKGLHPIADEDLSDGRHVEHVGDRHVVGPRAIVRRRSIFAPVNPEVHCRVPHRTPPGCHRTVVFRSWSVTQYEGSPCQSIVPPRSQALFSRSRAFHSPGARFGLDPAGFALPSSFDNSPSVLRPVSTTSTARWGPAFPRQNGDASDPLARGLGGSSAGPCWISRHKISLGPGLTSAHVTSQ